MKKNIGEEKEQSEAKGLTIYFDVPNAFLYI